MKKLTLLIILVASMVKAQTFNFVCIDYSPTTRIGLHHTGYTSAALACGNGSVNFDEWHYRSGGNTPAIGDWVYTNSDRDNRIDYTGFKLHFNSNDSSDYKKYVLGITDGIITYTTTCASIGEGRTARSAGPLTDSCPSSLAFAGEVHWFTGSLSVGTTMYENNWTDEVLNDGYCVITEKSGGSYYTYNLSIIKIENGEIISIFPQGGSWSSISCN